MSRKGPFGLWMGMTIDDIGTPLQEIAPAKYQTKIVPKPHSSFESYILQITPNAGLSWVKALGHPINTSVFGVELKSAFDAMEKKLSTIYGKHDRTDILLPDSIWNEPRDWMQSFLHRERYLLTEWCAQHGSSLSDSLASVALVVGVIDTNSGYIAIEYSFENSTVAEAEITTSEDEAL